MHLRKMSRINLETPPGKVSQKKLEKPSTKASQKSSRKPSSKSCQKKPSRKSSQKDSENPSRKILQKNSKAVVSASKKNCESNSKAVVHKSTFCFICKKSYTSKKLLNKHNSKHHFYRHCPNCPKTFQRTRKFVFHLRSHLEDHPYECKICLESFNQKKDLLAHKVVHRSSSRLSCETCNQVFPHLASLNRHRLAHFGPPYACDDCRAVFSNVRDRTVHTKNHVQRCILCPKEVVAFPSIIELADHMYSVHHAEKHDPTENGLDAFEPCVSTGAVKLEDNDDSDSMNDLSSSDHDSDEDIDSNYQRDAVEPVYNLKRRGKFMCFICYDLYPSCELLKSHMKAHNWYPCSSCPRFFPDVNTLEEHICEFSKRPSFRCQNCNSECEVCKNNCKTVDISEMHMNDLQGIVPRFQEMPTFGITDYADVSQRNWLINFIQHIKSQEGPLDLESFNLIGFHNTNLKIIIKHPEVNCLFPRQCIHDLEELYSKFQNLSHIMLDRMNRSSAQ